MNDTLSRQAEQYPISIFYGSQANQTGQVDKEVWATLKELQEVVIQSNWSPAIFNEDEHGIKRRNKGNLKRIALLALDIDDGCTLEEAKTIFKDYCCIIATTRHHRKEKPVRNGRVKPACDRFRVILILSEDVYKDEDFKATWFEAVRKWPFIDPACKDSCHFFYPCVDIVYSNLSGSLFPVTTAPTKSQTTGQRNTGQPSKTNPAVPFEGKGRLSWRTQDFLLHGADPWHDRYVLACIDFKEQRYTLDEATAQLTRVTGHLTEEDERQLRWVYDNHVPKYPPRAHYADRIKQEDDTSFTFGARLNERSYSGSTPEQRLKRINDEKAIRLLALKSQVPFVCDAFDGVFSLTMGLTMIGACTGGGKTTTSANILAHFFLCHPDKQALVITNEETAEDVINRIACVLLEVNFFKFRNNQLPEEIIQAVEFMAQKVAQRVEVVDKVDGWDMTCLEDVQAVLEYAMRPDKGFGLIIVDYLQTVTFSRTKEDLDAVKVSKNLGHYLKEYGRRVPVPVVVFSQLHPDPEKKMEFSTRFQNDRTIVNHAVAAIEVIPDYETHQTKFLIHKNRFGEVQKQLVKVAYRDGRFTPLRMERFHPASKHADNESFIPKDGVDKGARDGEVPF